MIGQLAKLPSERLEHLRSESAGFCAPGFKEHALLAFEQFDAEPFAGYRDADVFLQHLKLRRLLHCLLDLLLDVAHFHLAERNTFPVTRQRTAHLLTGAFGIEEITSDGFLDSIAAAH